MGAFLGAFDKYVEIMCYFRELFPRFGSIRKLFGVFLTNFEKAQNFLCYFLCFFLKNSEFGSTPEFRENSRISGAGNSSAQTVKLRLALEIGCSLILKEN